MFDAQQSALKVYGKIFIIFARNCIIPEQKKLCANTRIVIAGSNLDNDKIKKNKKERILHNLF